MKEKDWFESLRELRLSQEEMFLEVMKVQVQETKRIANALERLLALIEKELK